MRKYLFILMVTLYWSSLAFATPFEYACARLATEKGADTKRLHRLFALVWDHEMREYPEGATFVGYPGVNDRWTDRSLEAISRRKREAYSQLKVLNSINRKLLSQSDRLNYDLFRRSLEESIEGAAFGDEYLAIGPLSGPQQSIAQVLSVMNLSKEPKEALQRLAGVPKVIDQTIALLEEGLRQKITPPRITMRDVPGQVESMLSDNLDRHPIFAPFRESPDSNLKSEASLLLKDKVAPAFKRLHEFLVNTYIPGCRETIAWSALPRGKEWYAHNVRHHTTTNLSPDQIHEIGLSEVKRIRAEMEQIIKSTGFKGEFADFINFLRTDSRFFFQTTGELLQSYRDIAKRIDPELPRLFGKLPRLPYGVKPVPTHSEKSQTTAYYEPGSPAAGRAGIFFANTFNLKMRPKWEMEALTLHEAVPGHHLQIALAQELENVPEFRRHSFHTAYVEGWGLYAESLGEELGLFKDPYSRFGQLTYEMWRAIRLVVDTGMHHKGWSRQQAIEFFKQNSSKTDHDITVEVDRYIVWAGQALAYKIGELKIKELKSNAKSKLGKRFDVRKFHDLVLANGAVPLDTLEQLVTQWVRSPKQR